MAKIDPTINVIALVKAEAKRLDKKIKANERHAQQLREAESKRIDANRSGDQRAIEIAQGTFKDIADRLALVEQAQAANSGRLSITTVFITLAAAIASAIIAWFAKK